MSKFTKGKWEYHEYVPEGITLNGIEYLISSDGEDVALARYEADARLIAAAPEMYELLQRVAYGSCDVCVPLLVSAREIITRIDGLKGGECS